MLEACGISGDRCIHTHPIKRQQDISAVLTLAAIRWSSIIQVSWTNLPYRDQCRLLIRVSFRADNAVVDLSYKFGCAPEHTIDLIRQARDMGFSVRGLSFHVGSQAANPAMHLTAIQFCRQLFNLAALDGIALECLDIGGGFPVSYREPVLPIETFCQPIISELQRSFDGVQIIAEPGRYIAAPAMTLVCSVMGTATRGGKPWYYLDDGVYGSFSGQMYDHCRYHIAALSQLEAINNETTPSVLAGPTCDSIDIVDDSIPLPQLTTGDLLVAPMMGAYSLASATTFNHFPKTRVITID